MFSSVTAINEDSVLIKKFSAFGFACCHNKFISYDGFLFFVGETKTRCQGWKTGKFLYAQCRVNLFCNEENSDPVL